MSVRVTERAGVRSLRSPPNRLFYRSYNLTNRVQPTILIIPAVIAAARFGAVAHAALGFAVVGFFVERHVEHAGERRIGNDAVGVVIIDVINVVVVVVVRGRFLGVGRRRSRRRGEGAETSGAARRTRLLLLLSMRVFSGGCGCCCCGGSGRLLGTVDLMLEIDEAGFRFRRGGAAWAKNLCKEKKHTTLVLLYTTSK